MNIAEKNKILFQLGGIFNHLAAEKDWPGYDLGINESEYEEIRELVERVHIYNGWFSPTEVKKALKGIAKWLDEETLENWISPYLSDQEPKRVAIIMAGNIPLVGFHDFLSVFLSGHKAVVKLSSDDQHLFPAIVKIMQLFDERIDEWVEIVEDKMENFDAVIATGSDNSARYFKSYFGKYPHIIRKNRTSVGILKGDESKEELNKFGKDIFDFYGLGCRNVSQIWVPEDFDLDHFFESIYDYNPIIHHNKYANNYDYNKAVFLMNREKLLDNGFLLLKEEESLNSPLAVLHYNRYKSPEEFEKFIEREKEHIQVIVGKDYLDFGEAQQPEIDDYADGVNTLEFLTKLGD